MPVLSFHITLDSLVPSPPLCGGMIGKSSLILKEHLNFLTKSILIAALLEGKDPKTCWPCGSYFLLAYQTIDYFTLSNKTVSIESTSGRRDFLLS